MIHTINKENTIVFVPNKEKQNIIVGFAKNDFKNHQGATGLKYYLIVMYLRKHTETFGQVTLSLNKLLTECGYSTKSHNKSMYTDFIEIIKTEILDKEYATCDTNIFSVNPNEMFSLQLSEKKNIFFTEKNFVQFSIDEYEKIVSSDSKINKSILAGVYLFIKQYIMNYAEGTTSTPKISFPSKNQIKNGLGISSTTTVENALSVLVDIKMIYIRSGMYIKKKNTQTQFIATRNVFALNEKELVGDAVLIELEKLYGQKVYNECDVDGKIIYLEK